MVPLELHVRPTCLLAKHVYFALTTARSIERVFNIVFFVLLAQVLRKRQHDTNIIHQAVNAPILPNLAEVQISDSRIKQLLRISLFLVIGIKNGAAPISKGDSCGMLVPTSVKWLWLIWWLKIWVFPKLSTSWNISVCSYCECLTICIQSRNPEVFNGKQEEGCRDKTVNYLIFGSSFWLSDGFFLL